MTPDAVIDFWLAAGESRWFTRDAAFDGELSVRFKEALARARDGAFDHWAETPKGALALIILLDQFSRNIHRGTPLAFAADRKALALARSAVARGDHLTMPATLARWIIMPFEHAEDLDAQMRCVALFTVRDPEDMTHWARLHLEIIARFGRFPHRNAILGRKSTPEELAFLAAGGFAG
jgi:uncharacterized protein (DUF924 family)